MLDNFVRDWKQWLYDATSKTMKLLKWKSGSNKIISPFTVEHYRVIEYTSDKFNGATLKPGPKWRHGTIITPVLLDKNHAESGRKELFGCELICLSYMDGVLIV